MMTMLSLHDKLRAHSFGVVLDEPIAEPQPDAPSPVSVEQMRDIACNSSRQIARAWEEADRNWKFYLGALAVAALCFVVGAIGWMNYWLVAR